MTKFELRQINEETTGGRICNIIKTKTPEGTELPLLNPQPKRADYMDFVNFECRIYPHPVLSHRPSFSVVLGSAD